MLQHGASVDNRITATELGGFMRPAEKRGTVSYDLVALKKYCRKMGYVVPTLTAPKGASNASEHK